MADEQEQLPFMDTRSTDSDDDVVDVAAIPFDDLEPGTNVHFRWTSPHSDEEQSASGQVSEVDHFIGEASIDDGTPFVLVDATGEDRDYRVHEALGGEVQSVTYDTVPAGNARRIGELVWFEVES